MHATSRPIGLYHLHHPIVAMREAPRVVARAGATYGRGEILAIVVVEDSDPEIVESPGQPEAATLSAKSEKEATVPTGQAIKQAATSAASASLDASVRRENIDSPNTMQPIDTKYRPPTSSPSTQVSTLCVRPARCQAQ